MHNICLQNQAEKTILKSGFTRGAMVRTALCSETKLHWDVEEEFNKNKFYIQNL